MTTVYLVRHSEGFKSLEGIFKTNDSIQLINEKSPLSYDGEKLAEKIANNKEFSDIDVVWCSNYARAMSTAKYFAINSDLKVNLDDRLGERIHGINTWKELSVDFEERQFLDETYKIGFGENQVEVRNRMEEVFDEILNANLNKRIVIVGHSTAFAFLLKKWCVVNYDKPYMFNGKVFFDGKWNYCEIFKLEFDNNNKLMNITNLK